MKNNKPHLLILSHEFTEGGASTYTLRLINQLLEHYQLHLWIVGKVSQSLLTKIPAQVQVWHQYAPRDHHRGHRRFWQFMPNWLNIQSQLPPHTQFAAVFGMLLLPGTLATLLYNSISAKSKYLFLLDESFLGFKHFHPNLQSMLEECCRQTNCLVSVSEDLLKKTQYALPSCANLPTLILAPLLDNSFLTMSAPAVSERRQPPWRLLTVARLVSGKNILRCIEIHQALKKSGIACQWQVAGEGPLHSKLQAQIRRLGLEQDFVLLGQRQDIPQLMAQADLFVLLSDSEGCPTVVLEALQCHCPVITTPVNGVKRYIQEGQNGYVVDFDLTAQVALMRSLLHDYCGLERLKAQIQTQTNKIDSDLPIFMKHLEQATQANLAPYPKVLLVIPTYNQAAYLDQAISSALMQSYENLKVVVLDDASTDETPELIEKWRGDNRLQYIRQPHNLGRCANYRYAVHQLEDSDWMVMLDGDDFYTDPNFITQAIHLAQVYHPVFIQAGHTTHYEDGSQTGSVILPDISKSHEQVLGPAYLQHLFRTGFFTHLGIVFQRSAAREVALYETDISSSDMESFMRLAQLGKVILMNQSVGHWRQHPKNSSRQLQPQDVPANVAIFRAISQECVRQGFAHISDFEPHLTRYEARTYAYLYQQALQQSKAPGLKDLILSIWEINPSMLLQRKIIQLIGRVFIQSLKRSS